jgi:uncharacterized protein (DUF433 family)
LLIEYVRDILVNNDELLNRIETNPKVMTGKPVIKGTRLTVQHILSLLGQGMSEEEIINEYNGLVHEDIMACLLYASEILDNTSILPVDEAV